MGVGVGVGVGVGAPHGVTARCMADSEAGDGRPSNAKRKGEQPAVQRGPSSELKPRLGNGLRTHAHTHARVPTCAGAPGTLLPVHAAPEPPLC